MRKRSQRLWLIGAAGALAAGAIALAATGLQDTVAFFYAPSDIAEKGVAPGRSVRVGGLMEEGSFSNGADGAIHFRITDGREALPVVFTGLLPDLAVEGQGIVAEGRLDENGQLVAQKVIARHDENYMPKEVYEALKDKAGSEGAAGYEGPAT
jgi:cytochrome c-type biogenesis protein CcmE